MMDPTKAEPILLDRAAAYEKLRDPAFDPGTGSVLLVDKPKGWTSFDVVAFVRGRMRVRKVGHCGTLDPMATGLLILCLGPATRLAEHYQAETKKYLATIRFGATTPSDDADTEPDAHFPVAHLNEESVVAAMTTFLGETLQTPPMYSARKVGGQRLYKLARRGEEVERQPRPVTIYEFTPVAFRLPDELDASVVCSKGTYIRTLARDLGTALDTGAHLTALRRSQSGSFSVDSALSIDDIRTLRPRDDE